MIVWRVLPWQSHVAPARQGGALWFARPFQGAGRHDNPSVYGCMYVSESPVSPVAEALAPFRGAGRLTDEMLMHGGVRLALARLHIDLKDSRGDLVDLDDARTLVKNGLAPSAVATHMRATTQLQAMKLNEDHPNAVGIRWWSTLESTLINLTLFDRCAHSLRQEEVSPLSRRDEPVQAAAQLLGLQP